MRLTSSLHNMALCAFEAMLYRIEVGCEAHAGGKLDGIIDKVKTATFLATDHAHVLREAIWCCRKGGTISIPGVYIGALEKVPFGAAMNKGLTMKMGQTHVPKYNRMLLERIQNGDIDPSFVITHEMPLEDAPHGYEIFKHKQDGCIKVVLKPQGGVSPRSNGNGSSRPTAS